MVESGLFCAQPSKYRVYFSARFDQPFAAHGTWSGAGPPGGHAYRVRSRRAAAAYVTFAPRAHRGGARGDLLRERGRRAGQPGREPHAQLRGGARRRAPDVGPSARARAGAGRPAHRPARVRHLALPRAARAERLLGPRRALHGHGRPGAPRPRLREVRRHLRLGRLPQPDPAHGDAVPAAGRRTWPPRCWPTPRESGCLPRWPVRQPADEHDGGRPGGADLASTYALGARGFNAREALRAMVRGADRPCHTANGDYTEREVLSEYLRLGYLPHELDVDVITHILGRDRPWGSHLHLARVRDRRLCYLPPRPRPGERPPAAGALPGGRAPGARS